MRHNRTGEMLKLEPQDFFAMFFLASTRPSSALTFHKQHIMHDKRLDLLSSTIFKTNCALIDVQDQWYKNIAQVFIPRPLALVHFRSLFNLLLNYYSLIGEIQV